MDTSAHSPRNGWSPLPLRHPALLAAATVVAICLVLSVSFVIFDGDIWEHLLVGKAIWMLRRVPTTQLWTWPTYGAPDVNPSWGFSALIWPIWSAAGVTGLFAWRWLTALTAFALSWMTARRLGARGFAALFVIALAALVYRQRSQVRPETLAAVLLALELWILERRREPGAADRAPWLILVAWIWANAHISYWVGLFVMGLHVIGGVVGRSERTPPRPGRLALVGGLAAAVSFANPYGWRALAQPFEYFLFWRHEPIYGFVGELWPVQWSGQITSGLPLIVAGWPLLWIWRALRGRVDLVEAMTMVAFTTLGLSTQRFLGVYVLIATPYLARGVSEWIGARRWSAVLASPWVRAAATGIVCFAMSIPEWSRPELALGLAFDPREIPREACDAMVREGVRGRGLNDFQGGYLLARFWPDQSRLPFMDVHQAGTTEIRRLYTMALSSEESWRELDRRFRFDYVIATRRPGAEQFLDVLDADTTFRPIFVNDVVALLVRRQGPYASLAEREGYRIVPIGPAGRRALRTACATDTLLRSLAFRELERQTSATWCASAHDLWGELEAVGGHLESARAHFEQATLNDPLMVGPRERLGLAELFLGHPERALEEFQRESRLRGAGNGIDLRLGQAYRRLGRLDAARAAFRREVARGPWKQEAADSLASLVRVGS